MDVKGCNAGFIIKLIMKLEQLDGQDKDYRTEPGTLKFIKLKVLIGFSCEKEKKEDQYQHLLLKS